MSVPSQPANRRPPRKSNFFFLLLMACMALWLFNQFQSVSARAKAAREQQPTQRPVPERADGTQIDWEDDVPDISDIRVPDRIPHSPPGSVNPHAQETGDVNPYKTERGDWSIDTDIPSTGQKEVAVPSGGSRTQSGDWQLEVGDSQPATDGESKSKSTRRGDWEISEVD